MVTRVRENFMIWYMLGCDPINGITLPVITVTDKAYQRCVAKTPTRLQVMIRPELGKTLHVLSGHMKCQPVSYL